MTNLGNIIIIILILNLALFGAAGFIFMQVWQEAKTAGLSAIDSGNETVDPEAIRQFMKTEAGNIRLANSFFVTSENFLQFVEQIEASARQADVMLKINRVEEEPAIKVGFSGSGAYPAVRQFEALLENLPYGLVFVNLSLYQSIDRTGRALTNGVWNIEATVLPLTEE